MFNRPVRRPTSALALTLVATAALVLPVAAVDTVTQAVTAGARSASIANLTLSNVAYSHTAQLSAGTMVLTADDSTGSNLGWNVTVLSSAFVYSGSNGGANIPAASFSLTAAAQPSVNAGQAVDALGVGGPKVPALSPIGTLDSARKTVQAAPLFGKGNYSQNLGVSLSIPAQSAAGTYTGTLTTTISAAP
jgi:hypothetical protein